MELDKLGQQLMLAFRFAQSRFNRRLQLEDEVEHETVSASDLFFENGGRHFMRSESIPGLVAVKAIAVDSKGIYLETSPINAVAVQAAIEDRKLPVVYKDGKFWDVRNGRIIAEIGPPTKPSDQRADLDIRCLWTMQAWNQSRAAMELAIRTADLVYAVDAYEAASEEEHSAPAPTGRPGLRLTVSVSQRLQHEQRPVLSLTAELNIQITQRLELREMQGLERMINTMNSSELPEFFASYSAEHGERQALSVAVFALAGKIKRVRPSMPWKEARRIARKKLHVA